MTIDTENTATESKGNRPTHYAKTRNGEGKDATYEQIGVAWLTEESGALYIKLYGTQIVSNFALYPIKKNTDKDTETGE